MGSATVDLVTTCAVKLARTGRFCTPSGSRHWSRHDVEDLMGDFFVRTDGVASLALVGVDARGLIAQVEKQLRYAILDRLRATPRGVLRRRTKRRLQGRSDVCDVEPSHWSLRGFAENDHWGGGREPLDAAAAAVRIDQGADWQGERQAPACTTQSLDAVCDAVFTTAAAPVDRKLTLTVVSERIIPDDLNRVVLSEAGDRSDPSVEGDLSVHIGPTPGERATARTAAEGIFAQLDDNERRVLPYVGEDMSLREIAALPEVTIGRTTLGKKLPPLKARLRKVFEVAPDRELLMRELLTVRAEWLEAIGQKEGGEP